MTLAIALGAGFLAGRLVWLLLRPTFNAPLFRRANYRGHDLPTAAGIVLPLALVVVEAGRLVAGAADVGERATLDAPRALTLLAALGFALLGMLDDLAGDTSARGFRGHLRALASGVLTTGGVKLLGGGALAVVLCARGGDAGLGGLARDAALVALAANLGNLLDRAPGRAIKGSLAAFLPLAVVAADRRALVAAAVVVGAGVALLGDDLRERLMLGDTGANVLGAVVGFGVVIACAPGTRLACLVVVATLNIAAEVVSFTRVIDAVPPLRALDRWGSRR